MKFKYSLIALFILSLSVHIQAQDSLFFQLGKNFYQNKQYDSSIAAYTKCIELSPDNDDCYYFRGLTYFDQKNFRASIRDFLYVVSITPDDFTAYNYLGLNYMALNNDTMALNFFQQAYTLNNGYIKPLINAATIKYQAEEYDVSIKLLTVAIETDPKAAHAYYNRAKCYIQKGEHDKALEDAKMAAEIEPSDISLNSLYEQLSKQQSDNLKKKLTMYAGIAIAFLAALYFFFKNRKNLPVDHRSKFHLSHLFINIYTN